MPKAIRPLVVVFHGRQWLAATAAALLLGLLLSCTGAGAVRSPVHENSSANASLLPASSPSPQPSPAQLPSVFRGTVSLLPQALVAEMRGTTWHVGCPVPLSDLRLLTLRYWGFDGRVHEGRMVVNARVARDVVWVFRRLFVARFPIEQLHLAVRYRPNQDDPNDRRDYTAGFNCRPVVTARGPLSFWSQHAYGWAIDINPIQNPYVTADGYVRNIHARAYRDRSIRRPGMVHPGDVVVRAFAAIGWKWAGYWSGDKDYMHFSLTGR